MSSPEAMEGRRVKVTVIGGGSTYTPELIEGLAARADRLPIDELVLQDVNPSRLEVVGGLARRMLERAGWPGRMEETGDPVRAIDGASFVLIQLRVGGQAARLIDETLPPRFGTIGQETTGAGGFAKALRTLPVILGLAELTSRRGAPDAWIIDFTNPVGIVTQALVDDGYRAIGLCNVAITLQRRAAALLDVDPDTISLEHVGLNHLSWVRGVRLDGADLLPELLARDGPSIAEEIGVPLAWMRRVGAIPSYYLRYYEAFDEVLAEQRSGHTRAEEVIEIEAQLLDLYRDPTLSEKPALLTNRGGAFYSEAAARLLASLSDGRGDEQVVDVRNDGAIAELPANAVVEIGSRIDRAGAHPVRQRPLPDEMRELILAVKEFERLTIRAAATGDRRLAHEALRVHPLVGQRITVTPLLDALLEANRAFLPRFFGGEATG
jgi:6-phospho-beta-glucosidase